MRPWSANRETRDRKYTGGSSGRGGGRYHDPDERYGSHRVVVNGMGGRMEGLDSRQMMAHLAFLSTAHAYSLLFNLLYHSIFDVHSLSYFFQVIDRFNTLSNCIYIDFNCRNVDFERSSQQTDDQPCLLNEQPTRDHDAEGVNSREVAKLEFTVIEAIHDTPK